MRLSIEITVSMNGALKFKPGSVTTRIGSPSRTTSDCLLLVAFGDLHDLRRSPACVGNDTVGISLRLVLQALEIGSRGLHVAKRIDHLRGRIDLLHLDLRHMDA